MGVCKGTTMVSSIILLHLLACLASAQLPVPGTIPGLSLDQQFAYIQQLQNHLNTQVQWSGRRRRSAFNIAVPGTTSLVPGSAAEAQWYQQQLAQIALTAGRKKRALPVPGTTGLVPGFAAEAQWYQQQLAQIALIAGTQKRAIPGPGTTGLVPGSAAEAQWYQQQLAQIALTAGRKKRALP